MGTQENAGAPVETNMVFFVVAWFWAGAPLAWGVLQTFHKAAALFQ
jgi:hypothetical protein